MAGGQRCRRGRRCRARAALRGQGWMPTALSCGEQGFLQLVYLTSSLARRTIKHSQRSNPPSAACRDCWAADPAQRPSCSDVLARLRAIAEM